MKHFGIVAEPTVDYLGVKTLTGYIVSRGKGMLYLSKGIGQQKIHFDPMSYLRKIKTEGVAKTPPTQETAERVLHALRGKKITVLVDAWKTRYFDGSTDISVRLRKVVNSEDSFAGKLLQQFAII